MSTSAPAQCQAVDRILHGKLGKARGMREMENGKLVSYCGFCVHVLVRMLMR